ncbi:hypothetical protein DFH27DRAFT_633178 [Peziza echinospora]|nr:hypothetical protein DFH27DRAFT_633178 [Peziza echinospora]
MPAEGKRVLTTIARCKSNPDEIIYISSDSEAESDYSDFSDQEESYRSADEEPNINMEQIDKRIKERKERRIMNRKEVKELEASQLRKKSQLEDQARAAKEARRRREKELLEEEERAAEEARQLAKRKLLEEQAAAEAARRRQREMEANATENILKDLAKQCPKCRSWIQKNGGCDHMTCRAPTYNV